MQNSIVNTTQEVIFSTGDNKYLYLDGSPVPKGIIVGIISNGLLELDENMYTYEDLK